MTDIWKSGTTYVPGSLVKPSTSGPPTNVQPANAGFESGTLSDWTTGGAPGWTVATDNPYSGTYAAKASGGGIGTLTSDTKIPVSPGDLIRLDCRVRLTNAGTNDLGAQAAIVWLDASDAVIGSPVMGTLIYGKGGFWTVSTCQKNAPAGAASFKPQLSVNTGSHGGNVEFDSVAITYYRVTPPAGLVFKATQADPGKSGVTEPVWPTSAGVSVTDNEVTWEGVIATRLVWQASPILQSGGAEPTWPVDAGGMVRDGTIDWTAVSRRIEDENCPNSKIVAIAAGKVYAGDNDIIRYCSTVNPLDWSAEDDAGYLPFGLNTYGANPVAAMNLYRSNLVAFNAEGFQPWQVDADPANSTLLDALPVASTYNKALVPVANDLLFLSSQGVRSIGIAASSTNLQAGDVGMPIDVLVKAKMASTADEPRGTFLPALGQYWIAFNATDRSTCTVFVYTLNQIGQVGKWSRYVFPFPIDGFMQLGDSLYLRSNDDVLRYDEDAVADFAGDEREQEFPGLVQYQWLDFGKPGVSKQVMGFDLVGSGNPSFALGYDQTSEGTFTTDFAVPADTVPGQIIPLPVMAPSMSVRVSYPGGQKWQLQAVNVYLQDMRAGS